MGYMLPGYTNVAAASMRMWGQNGTGATVRRMSVPKTKSKKPTVPLAAVIGQPECGCATDVNTAEEEAGEAH